MNKDVLTLLGCSSSLTLVLLVSTSAQANTLTPLPKELVFTAPQAEPGEVIEASLAQENLSDSEYSDCGCSGYNSQEADFTDEEGDRAIAAFGCDCAGCRYIVRNQL